MKLSRFNEANYAHFVTTKTFRNKPLFKDEQCREIILEDIDFYRKKLKFKLIGYCIMLDHLHMIVWWDVEKDKDLTISIIMHRIKGRSAKRISDYLLQQDRQVFYALPSSRRGIKAPSTHGREITTRDAIKIWQPSFYDFNIYSNKKLQEKLNYIHWNPVRAGLCKNPKDWPWSSYRFYAFGKERKMRIDTL